MKKNWRRKAGTTFSTEKKSAVGSRGMIVTNNPLGSAAGAEMFASGGNAIDAAVASLFALTVVEPMMVGIFGAGMSTLRLSGGEYAFINNYTVAPAAAKPDMYRTISDSWPDYQIVADRANDVGPLAVGVPGSLMGWCQLLESYGTLSLEEVMQPAIRYAERGYRATKYLSGIIRMVAADIERFAETAKIYMPGGQPLQAGDVVINPDYAATLKLVAKEGADVLYGGELGSAAVDYLQEIGGLITQDDLTDYRTVSADVIRGSYRDYEIVGPPPPSAGGVHVVEMLNILEAYDVEKMGFGSADSIHLLAEVLKIGFEDRNKYTGDPAFVDVPVGMLIDKEFAARRRAEIDLSSARNVNTAYTRESNHTTHLTAADGQGNVIAATHTIHSAFGSKVTVPGTGMLLNNTMNIFDPHPGLANSIQPGKRVTSSMSPIIAQKDGETVFALGLVGGTRIFPTALQVIVNLIDHGMTAQEAVEAPRLWTLGEDLEMEMGVDEKIRLELSKRGHNVKQMKVIGGGMGVISFADDEMTGASCWRADGTPIGVAGGMARGSSRFEI